MGLTIGEIEVGKDYRLGQQRVRALGINKLEERSYSRSRPRMVRHIRIVPVDTQTGEPDGREERHVLAKDIHEPWDQYIERHKKFEERNAPRVAGEKAVKEAVESVFLFEDTPAIVVGSHLGRRYSTPNEDNVGYVVELRVPDVLVPRLVAVLNAGDILGLPLPTNLQNQLNLETGKEN